MQVLVLCYGRRQLREGTITTGSLVTFLLYQAKVSHHVQVRPHDACLPHTHPVSICPRPKCQRLCPIQALVFGHGDLLSKAAASRKILEYLEREPTGDTGGTWAPTTLHGHVAFQHVSFAYPARPERLVLQVELGVLGVPKKGMGVSLSTHHSSAFPPPFAPQDVSFKLHPGEVTALAGLNGSGKSTCAGLLERFYEPGTGDVLLDGVLLRDYEYRYLHRQVRAAAGGQAGSKTALSCAWSQPVSGGRWCWWGRILCFSLAPSGKTSPSGWRAVGRRM